MSSARRLDRERVELLDARHRDRRRLGRGLVPDDVVVDLAGAEHEAAHLVAWRGRSRRAPARKAPSLKLGELRGGVLQPQQPLGRHDDERAGARVERLAAEQVEVLRRRARGRDADVLLRCELEEALEPRARVLGPVALVAVRAAAA